MNERRALSRQNKSKVMRTINAKEKRMKKKSIGFGMLILLLIFGLASVGCATQWHKKSLQIHQGMTQQEVLTLLGQPDARDVSGNREKWLYNKVGPFDASYVNIIFIEEKVDSIESDSMNLIL
jgi:hypothetical protein